MIGRIVEKPHIVTFTKKKVNPLYLEHKDIDILDIAHALALCNRFAGHTASPISVAQHSVFVSRLCAPQGYALPALLHDASEAYLGDVTKWVKESPEMANYVWAEFHAQRVIYEVFNCFDQASSPEFAACLNDADKVMATFEYHRGYGEELKLEGYPPLSLEDRLSIGQWEFWDWMNAEFAFLSRFHDLCMR